MSDPHPARLNERDDKREVKRVDKREERREDKRSFLQKLAEFLHPGPDSKDELIETLAEAEDNEIINAQSRFMLEGVIRMADMSAGGISSSSRFSTTSSSRMSIFPSPLMSHSSKQRFHRRADESSKKSSRLPRMDCRRLKDRVPLFD